MKNLCQSINYNKKYIRDLVKRRDKILEDMQDLYDILRLKPSCRQFYNPRLYNLKMKAEKLNQEIIKRRKDNHTIILQNIQEFHSFKLQDQLKFARFEA